MNALPMTSIVTLIIVLLMFATALNVGRARAAYGIKAPATSGHELFDRAYRIQMNTLEGTLLLLPALWIYAGTIGDRGAAIGGLVWVVGRIWYAVGYTQDPAKRGGGFGLATLALAGLWTGGLWGVIRGLI